MPDTIAEFLPDEAKDNLLEIIESVNGTKNCDFDIVFDPTLVRGMSYYTGTIFEIEVPEFGSSVGGGGRTIRWWANLPDRRHRPADFNCFEE